MQFDTMKECLKISTRWNDYPKSANFWLIINQTQWLKFRYLNIILFCLLIFSHFKHKLGKGLDDMTIKTVNNMRLGGIEENLDNKFEI